MARSALVTFSLLSLVPVIAAVGTARVVNNCGTPVYFASVAQSAHSSMQLLPADGYSETYSKANVGVSIKLSPSPNGPVTQFEITWGSPNIYYDISNIDGNPFAQQGMSLVPSMGGAGGYPSCVSVDCPAGQASCDAAYNLPDDVRTKVCPDDSDLTFTLCPGGPPAGNSVPAATQGTPIATSAAAPASTSQGKILPSSSAAQVVPGTTPTPKASNPGQSWPSYSRGGWGRQHTRRAHVRHFS